MDLHPCVYFFLTQSSFCRLLHTCLFFGYVSELLLTDCESLMEVLNILVNNFSHNIKRQHSQF